MSKQERIASFNPNGVTMNDHIYGLPFTAEDAEVIVLPVPWEVTVSYAAGTAKGPAAIREASWQVDLYDPRAENAWQLGIYMREENESLSKRSNRLRKRAKKYINALAKGEEAKFAEDLAEINDACTKMVEWVKEEALHILNKGKLLALLGGDHSTPLGYLQALGEKYTQFGILQIDAHADLRIAYEGFKYSHASIMYNALSIPQVNKLVQVGIRDYCQEEVDVMNQQGERVKTFFDRDLKNARYTGKTWKQQVDEIIAELPNFVYLSFDIDGLDPKLCPNTGTPVAGGFEAEEVLFLVEELVKSGKKLIGFDLNEVAPGEDEWDSNVGARMLYYLCNLLGKSNGKI
jgi:agmatinase